MKKSSAKKSFLLSKYLEQYRKDPDSRVFAPLAETYRKLGMTNDAFNVLKKGIRKHPNYVLGNLVLAHCYFDLNKFQECFDILDPIAKKEIDNLAVQKLYASACLRLGKLEQALDTLKYILFINPGDEEAKSRIKHLEDDLLVSQSVVQKDVSGGVQSQEDDWVAVDFMQQKPDPPSQNEIKSDLEDDSEKWQEQKDDQDSWEMMEHRQGQLNGEQEKDTLDLSQLDDDELLDDDTDLDFTEDSDPQSDPFDESYASKGSPFITFTLVDIYENQGHLDKAYEVISKMHENNPDDSRILDRMHELKMKLDSKDKGVEQSGHDKILSIIDKRVKSVDSGKQSEQKVTVIREKLGAFLQLVKERSDQLKQSYI